MNAAFYSDNDPHCAQWLRNLIDAGHITPGRVDARDVRDLAAEDINGFQHCHFFAGIGGWSYALRLAGWPDDRPVWTGSCPCQPFSHAGSRKGHADERHLWPAWARLIRECRPVVVFGEQVAGIDGRAWLDVVCAELEDIGYAVATLDLPAAGVGAPHIRPRLWFVGDASGARPSAFQLDPVPRPLRSHEGRAVEQSGATRGAWADAQWLACSDGKARPTEPGIFPLAHGLPGRVGRLRAYGNAVVPQAAAAVIRAYMEHTSC